MTKDAQIRSLENKVKSLERQLAIRHDKIARKVQASSVKAALDILNEYLKTEAIVTVSFSQDRYEQSQQVTFNIK